MPGLIALIVRCPDVSADRVVSVELEATVGAVRGVVADAAALSSQHSFELRHARLSSATPGGGAASAWPLLADDSARLCELDIRDGDTLHVVLDKKHAARERLRLLGVRCGPRGALEASLLDACGRRDGGGRGDGGSCGAGRVRLLLEAGAQATCARGEAEGGGGATALHLAAQQGNVAAMALLREAGAEVGARNPAGETPLHFAAMGADGPGAAEALRVLREWGADFREKTAYGGGAVHVAALCGNTAALRQLREWGADLNEPDGEGSTALLLAAESAQMEAVELLQSWGAKLPARGQGDAACCVVS